MQRLRITFFKPYTTVLSLTLLVSNHSTSSCSLSYEYLFFLFFLPPYLLHTLPFWLPTPHSLLNTFGKGAHPTIPHSASTHPFRLSLSTHSTDSSPHSLANCPRIQTKASLGFLSGLQISSSQHQTAIHCWVHLEFKMRPDVLWRNDCFCRDLFFAIFDGFIFATCRSPQSFEEFSPILAGVPM
ncbi:hypothetical protein CPB83DRAFT_395662 [Crepidotus variabilis]|uniref:Uncharacterized protein n=1 Tax=Crepidotus variabilis TaxID=179855 RepID=A0A9P6EEC7_9AGAR|nr:hypothetical protein CPB83DRAFT_395662 [Crepidotus variabilis]